MEKIFNLETEINIIPSTLTMVCECCDSSVSHLCKLIRVGDKIINTHMCYHVFLVQFCSVCIS